jgi:predicted nucleotidyltransferase
MRRGAPLPTEIEHRLATLGAVLEEHPAVRFAYVFGGAGRRDLRPLSDVDVAAYPDDAVDPVPACLDLIGVVTKHLGTDEVDLVVLNRAPTALLGRIVQSRRVIADKDPFLRHCFESLELRKFLDFRIFEQRFLDARFARRLVGYGDLDSASRLEQPRQGPEAHGGHEGDGHE